MTYQDWITSYIASNNGIVYGKCSVAVQEMIKVFPELKIVRGHIFDLMWGRRSHWWLSTADGEIIDPTKSQFPCVVEYEEWLPGTEVRVGKCMNCGNEIFAIVDSLDEPIINKSVCSDECEKELMKEFG
jgi:hypothetical protein